jgi:hypothetical protein
VTRKVTDEERNMANTLFNREPETGRREFLRTLLVGSGAAAVALASGGATAAETAEPVAAPKAEPKGYHVTEHIRDYYRTASL